MTGDALAPRANPDLVGHGPALAILATARASGRLPQAWLFSGPRGVGKATLAYRFARALLAADDAVGETLEMAPDEPVFRQVAAGAHPDLRVIEPPQETRTARLRSEIPVDAVREVTHALHATPAQGGRRVVIVDGAEHLNRNAANALLKPLEEPPRGAVLLLVSHRASRVPATLRSRCAKLHLGRLPEAAVEAILGAQRGELDPAGRAALARLARGSPGRAIELAASEALPLYRRLARALGDEPPDRLGLHQLAGDLARHAEQHGFVAALLLVQELLGRALGEGVGRSPPPLFAEEPAVLARLAARRPLDRSATLWEKIARLAAQADSVNLDRFQVLLHILSLLATARGRHDEGPAGGVSLGGRDVLA